MFKIDKVLTGIYSFGGYPLQKRAECGIMFFVKCHSQTAVQNVGIGGSDRTERKVTMNNAHKIAVLVLSFALLAAVSACGKQKENPDLLNDQITTLTETAEETTEETTETSTETTTRSTLESETVDPTATEGPTVSPNPPATTPLRTIPAPTAAPKQTAAPAPATTAAPAPATTAAPVPATAAATTLAPVPVEGTQPVPNASESPIGPGDPIELPLVPGETTTVAAETPLTPAGDPANPPMPNFSQNTVDENSGKLTMNGTDLYIGGNVSAFISVNPPLRQNEDPNPRLVNGQQVNCVEYSYTDYVIVCNAANNSVLYIDLSGSAIQTSKGIHVGSTVDEVTAAYGAGQTYTFGSNTLSFNFRDGIVNMITIGVQ